MLCYTPRTPFMHMTATVTGVETLVYMLADIPEETDALITAVGKQYSQACRIAIESPAELVMIPENMTSEVAGSYFDRYIKPYEEMWTKDIREAGKTSLIHMDGSLRGLIRDHVIHTLEIMRREPRFVLGAADQVPPDGLLERVKAIAELCESYGKYE